MRIHIAPIAILIAPPVLIGLAGCDAQPASFEFTGSTMGTRYAVSVVGLGEYPNSDLLKEDIERVLEGVDATASTYRDDSELMQFNANTSLDWVEVSRELALVIDTADAISTLTGGAFDVTVGPLVDIWGFGAEDVDPSVPSDALIIETQLRVGYSMLRTRTDPPGIKKDRSDLFLDLSAIAKGYGVDRIAARLDEAGIDDYLVEIGGEVRANGVHPTGRDWTIAIEQPLTGSRRVQKTFPLRDQSVATSGDYRNYFETGGRKYSHIIDPRSGRPVSHGLASVTVIARSAMTADALATGLLVLGDEHAYELAVAENLAVLFVVRHDGALDEILTPEFERLAANRK